MKALNASAPSKIQILKLTNPKKAFDHVCNVQTITNSDLTQLKIMNRADLASTFTKFSLWSQTQFSKIVYLDADTLPLRAPDELFSLDVPFAAAPELGFPDFFNSGVMVLQPSLETFEALKAEAIRDGSFDGGDQGLLNTHFPDFHKLSFMYNMELYPTYRLYMPAVLREKANIKLVHFIGNKKPWVQDRLAEPVDGTAYSKFYMEMLGKWFDVYETVEKEI